MTTALTRQEATQAAIQQHQDTLLRLLPDRAQQDRYLAAIMTHVAPNTDLHAPVLQPSLIVAVYHMAKLGLDPGVDANLIPRSGIVRCEITFKGAAKIMMRTPGAVKLHTYLIYQNEEYRIEQGRVVRHVASLDVDTRGPLVAAVAELHYADGTVVERIVDGAEIAIARARGKDAWKTSPGEMWRKTAILRLAKIVPLDSLTAGTLNEIERQEYVEESPAPRSTRRVLSAGPVPMQLAAAEPTELDPETVDVEADTDAGF